MTTSPTASPLRVQRRDDGVAVVTLALPERRNTMTAPMTEAFEAAVVDLKADPAVRCVVVTGEGTAFSAGGDVGWIGADPDKSVDELRTRMVPFYRSWLSIRDLTVPTIAAVNGPAVGAGLCLAMACDLRYATEKARMSVPFTTLGMHPGMGATYLLPEIVGVAAARDLFFTGRPVSGQEAVTMGLVSRVLPEEGFLDAVLETATTIAATAPVATKLTKVALAGSGHASMTSALEWESLAQPVTLATEDLQEGLRARAEKRRARFTGR